MIALMAYAGRDALRSRRWVAPLLVLAVVVAVLSATSGAILPTYAGVAATVLFVGIWLAVAVSNCEDPLQFTVTAVSAGSAAKVRIARLCVAALASAGLGILGLLPPALVTSSPVAAADLASGVVAVLSTSVAGVAIGAMCVRPIVRGTAWALLAGLGGGLATVLVPRCPPTRQLLTLLDGARLPSAGGLALVAAESLVLAAVLVTTSVTLAWHRS